MSEGYQVETKFKARYALHVFSAGGTYRLDFLDFEARLQICTFFTRFAKVHIKIQDTPKNHRNVMKIGQTIVITEHSRKLASDRTTRIPENTCQHPGKNSVDQSCTTTMSWHVCSAALRISWLGRNCVRHGKRPTRTCVAVWGYLAAFAPE